MTPSVVAGVYLDIKTGGNIPGEIIDDVLDHLDNDSATLRACTLVSHLWCSFARCHLFQAVVCPPDAPCLSPRHFSSFLSSTSEIVPYVRSLKIIGSKPCSEIEVAVEDVLLLLSALPNLQSLFFERVPLFTRARAHDPPIPMPPLPCARLSTIGLCAIRNTDTTHLFFRFLKDCLGPRAFRAILRFADREDQSSFPAFLEVFGPAIELLSCNLLGALGDVRLLAGRPDAHSMDFDPTLQLNVRVPTCTAVNELVLYITGSGVADLDLQLGLLWGQYLALREMLKFLPPDVPMRRITFRFQRFGPHIEEHARMFESLLDPQNWFHNGWMEELLLRFADLEVLTCVVCDDGLMEQYGDYLPADPTASIATGSVAKPVDRQEEYDVYANFLKKTYSRFDAKGLLRIQRA